MNLLTAMPINFTNSLSPAAARFVVFCATDLGIITILITIVFVLFRKIPEKGVFGPLQEIADRLRDILILTFSCVITYVTVFILKNIFHVIRPSNSIPNLHALIVQTDFGFPSGHASFYSALAVALFFINKKAGYAAGVIALIIGIARVISGVHRPIDVLAGFVVGTLIACLVDGFVSYTKIK